MWKTAADYANGAHIIVFYAENILGASSDTLTVTASGVTYFSVMAVEYAGLAPANSLDVAASNRTTGASYTTALTLASGDELLFGVHYVPGTGVSFTPKAPSSTVATLIGKDEVQVQDQIAVSAGPQSSTGTESSSTDTTSVVAAFRGAASIGGGGRPPTPPPKPPPAPTNRTATPRSSSQIGLTWDGSTAAGGIAGYVVYRNGAAISSTATTSYVDFALPPGTPYTYYVTAYDTIGRASYSSQSASAATVATGATTITWTPVPT